MPYETCFEASGTIIVSVDQVRSKHRFPGFQKDSQITPFTHTEQIACLPNRKFSVKITYVRIAPAVAATTYDFQGETCKSIASQNLKEPGRLDTSLIFAASRVRTLKSVL